MSNYTNKQKKEFFQNQKFMSLQCGLHCVNHLLGNHAYDPQDFTKICYRLSDQFINPHKHICGGDYSVDVLMVALSQKGYDCQWHDRRKQFDIDQSPETLGYLINEKTDRKFYHKMFGLSARHWVVIKRQGQWYFQYDSNKEQKAPMGKSNNTEERIRAMMKGEAQIIRVYKK